MNTSIPRCQPVQVMLVDDHAVVRTGYRRLLELEPDITVHSEHADADAAYRALSALAAEAGEPAGGGDVTLPVDVLVLDLSMPGRSGLDLLRRVTLRWPALRVLVFSMHDSPAMVGQALQSGAAGFVTKSSPPEQLVDAVRRVFGGQTVLSDDVAGALNAPGAQQPHQALSPRELEVLQFLVEGLTADEIAQRMHLSAKTVWNHQTSIRAKLGVSNAMELLRYAQQHRLIQL